MKAIGAIGLLTILLSPPSFAADEVGVATGYPPYQFDIAGEITGFDVAVARAVFDRMNEPLDLQQYDWDDVVGLLRFGEIDIAAGMEITQERLPYFAFSQPYYARETVIFIRDEVSAAETVADLSGKKITGDRQSELESQLKALGIYSSMRVMQTASKQEAMSRLLAGEVEAVIMPLQVGKYLAQQQHGKVRVLWRPHDKTEVAFAVRRGDQQRLQGINQALATLEADGTLQRLRDEWFKQAD